MTRPDSAIRKHRAADVELAIRGQDGRPLARHEVVIKAGSGQGGRPPGRLDRPDPPRTDAEAIRDITREESAPDPLGG
jgi:hypothetical protein